MINSPNKSSHHLQGEKIILNMKNVPENQCYSTRKKNAFPVSIQVKLRRRRRRGTEDTFSTQLLSCPQKITHDASWEKGDISSQSRNPHCPLEYTWYFTPKKNTLCVSRIQCYFTPKEEHSMPLGYRYYFIVLHHRKILGIQMVIYPKEEHTTPFVIHIPFYPIEQTAYNAF